MHHRRTATRRIALAALVPSMALTLVTAPASAAADDGTADSLVVEATISSIHQALAGGDVSCTDLVAAYVDRIETYDAETTNAVQVVSTQAMAAAAELDAEYARTGLTGPLHCVPVLVKDQVETADMPTTYGSAIFAGFETGRDATVVTRLREAGAVILAKTNMGEFASGWAGSAFGVCRNPYDLSRAASSSSCGTGAAVAANYGAVGIAEDTGGSTRGPAAWNNAVGLRPTTPLISRYGMMPANPTYDTLGPLTRTVEDAAIVTSVIAGPDPNDPLTAEAEGHVDDYAAGLDADDLEGKRVGVVREPMSADTDTTAPDYARVQAVVDAAYADMEALGAEVIEVEIPRLRELLAAYSAGGAETEAATNAYLADLADISDPPVATFEEIATSPLVTPTRQASLRSLLGRTTEDPEYLEGEQMREELRQAVLAVMDEHELDAIAHATFDHEAPVIPADQLTNPDATAGLRQGSNRNLAPVTGFPALAVPAGFTTAGIPVGIDLLGRPWSEAVLFEMAYAYEQGTQHRTAPADFPALPDEPGTTPPPAGPRPTATFHLSNDWRGTTHTTLPYGQRTDEVLIGDWDGDGSESVAVRRGSTFHVPDPTGAEAVLSYGRPGDAVLVGDWDGDGTDTFAVRRGATYYVKNSLRGGNADVVLTYGRPSDTVLVGDWDGNGTDTLAVRRGADFHVKNSLSGGAASVSFTFGRPGDIALTGDWDGNGTDTVAVQRDRTFHVSNSLRAGAAATVVTFGRTGDEVHVGDWDGDGSQTLGIRRTTAG
ncbi:amidase [Georgenia sp. 311]|uniref:amidase n=1 Tax=Georgenia sp. 311 TaxID=2585134 RepID=UPI001111B6CF|nr:amidase [Georgenia sp. 311]TNC18268.1 amidase [Georgenia sp. 311]